MSDDVKDFAYYADAAERIISGITEDMPVLDIAAVAACAQVFAALAADMGEALRKAGIVE